ncbi:MAG: peptidoglycan DD-metalloendopeptidase family protein [Anaerolineaceae bacterium]|nr:peptidoglycan DD-metalloendopeptidase family protein [Anaerolineaceae bacterium]
MEDTNLPKDEEFEHPYEDVSGPSHWENLASRESKNLAEQLAMPAPNASEVAPDPKRSSDDEPTQENEVNPRKKGFRLNYYYPIALLALAALFFLLWASIGSKTPAPTPTLPVISQANLPTPRLLASTLGPQPTLGEASTATELPQALPTSEVRTEVIEYTMEKGDTIYNVAEKFGLAPETLLMANRYNLGYKLVNYTPGVTLIILPVDGAYYQWQPGNGLNGVARAYHVNADAIVDYPGNHLDRNTLGDFANPNIPANTWLIIPGAYDEDAKVPAFAGIYPEAKKKMLSFAMVEAPEKITPRDDIVAYKTVKGDTLEGIAEKFGLKPETILWGNRYILGETPDGLFINQRLLIMPVDSVYYQWMPGDGLNGVAKYYQVSPDTIVDYPLNNLDRAAVGDFSKPNIKPGTMLIIPGGINPPPAWAGVTVDNNGVPGAHPNVGWLGEFGCNPAAAIRAGGNWTLPTGSLELSGYDWNPPTHYGVDYRGSAGLPLHAADAGVIIYSGWSDRGYGFVMVVDHGNGFLTLYAHMLPEGMLACGTTVDSGTQIGLMGSTGNSSGAHLHFEIRNNGSPVNPHDLGF